MSKPASTSPIPSQLEVWTLETVKRLAQTGENESDLHDFKARIPSQEKLSTAACAFANQQGGFLVVGVEQKNKTWKVAGIAADPEIGPKVYDRLKVTPSIVVPPPLRIPTEDPDRFLYVFEIPEGRRKPHVPIPGHDEPIRFYKRVGGKNAHMTLDEIRMMMEDTRQRRTLLEVLVHELQQVLLTLRAIERTLDRNDTEVSLDMLDIGAVDRLLSDGFSIIEEDAQTQQELYRLRRQLRAYNQERKLSLATISADPNANGPRIDANRASARRIAPLRQSIEMVGGLLEQKYGIENAQVRLKQN